MHELTRANAHVCKLAGARTRTHRLDADDNGCLNYDETLKGLKRLPIFKAAGIYLSPEDWEVFVSVCVHVCVHMECLWCCRAWVGLKSV